MKKILLLAGEESGVLYAKELASKLQVKSQGEGEEIEIRGYQDYGFETGDLAVFGFFAVLKKIFYFLRVKKTMEKAIDEWKPDVVVTIDYPGMNLKLAAYAKRNGIKAVHVVCPQVWAWHQGRIPKIEASLDKLCCFFPFEPGLFKPGLAEFVGHPLAWAFQKLDHNPSTFNLQPSSFETREAGLVAVLPGSRIGEIEKHLAIQLEAVKGRSYLIPAASKKAYNAIVKLKGNAENVIMGGARELLRKADVAIVASGTASLEAALAGVPTVIVYKVGALTASFLRRAIKGVKHVGLANIIAEKAGAECPLPELLQENFTAANVKRYVDKWLDDPQERAKAVEALSNTMKLLVTDSDPIAKIAELITR